MYILQFAFSLATKVKLEVNATWKLPLHLKFPFYQTHLYKLGRKPSQLEQTSHLYISFSDLSPIIYINSTKPSSVIHRKWKKKMKASYIALFALVVLLLAEAQVSMAVTCSPTQLSSCVSAITSSSPPSQLCCSKIKEQKPCLCQYLRNPTIKKFINTPNARKVATTCGTPFPKC